MKKSLVALGIALGASTTASAAVYELEELSTITDKAKHHYITSVNNNGEVIGLTRGVFNLPIDTSYIDFTDNEIEDAYDNWEFSQFEQIDKEITFTLDDIATGNINADALAFMLAFLSQQNADPNWQKVADGFAVNFTPAPAVEQVIFDEQSPDYDGLTRGVSNNYTALSEDGARSAWGSSPYSKIEFTPDGDDEEQTYFVRDYRSRGMLITPTGEKITLPVIDDTYGGQGVAAGIVMRPEGGYYVVGDSSTGVPEDRQENYDDNCDGEDEPVAVCVWSYENRASISDIFLTSFYDRRAVMWEVDASLNVVDTKELGLGLVPEEDEGNAFYSSALAVNSQGVAVGFSHFRDNDSDNVIRLLPAVFKNGEVLEILDQEDDWYQGKALSINEEGIVTGYGQRVIEGRITTKFFYHDTNTGTTEFPDDYFTSSSSVGRDINSNGVIVGEGEVDVVNSSSRRREGFIYSIGQDSVANINDLLPCYDTDGETDYPYTVSEATAIDDNGNIYGVATKTVEKRDARGGVEVDANGNILFESIAVPVKLTAIPGGEAETCAPEAAETYERQSANFGWLSLLMLPLVALRRRKSA